jgi:hypothetical protein
MEEIYGKQCSVQLLLKYSKVQLLINKNVSRYVTCNILLKKSFRNSIRITVTSLTQLIFKF